MNAFFKPSDITTRICSVSGKSKGGSAFGVCPDGEQVFISPKIVDAARIEVGDLLTAFCIDNHRSEEGRERYAVRWRAIRVVVQEKFAATPVVYASAPALQEALDVRAKRLLQKDRAWTARQMAEALSEDFKAVSNWLVWQAKAGHIAALKAYASTSQQVCSVAWYARDMDLIHELIDEVELE